VRLEFDPTKNRDVKRKHGVSLEDAQEIFDQTYLVDRRRDDPGQFRAIGFSGGRLCSVIFEIRHDADGEYYQSLRKTRKTERGAKLFLITRRCAPRPLRW
jgi:uncharacterized DUF497 family protein